MVIQSQLWAGDMALGARCPFLSINQSLLKTHNFMKISRHNEQYPTRLKSERQAASATHPLRFIRRPVLTCRPVELDPIPGALCSARPESASRCHHEQAAEQCCHTMTFSSSGRYYTLARFVCKFHNSLDWYLISRNYQCRDELFEKLYMTR